MNFLIGIINLLILGTFFWWVSRKFEEIKPYYGGALLLKLISGLGVGLLYYYHYGYGDTFTFFEKASELADLLRNNPLAYFDFLIYSSDEIFASGFEHQPRALFFVKITSIFCFFTANNYWITSLYFSALSFLGACYITKLLVGCYHKHKLAIIFAFLFFPSTVFWTSGILKESLAAAVLFSLVGAVLSMVLQKRYRKVEIILSIISAIILWKIKYYYAGVVFITLAALTFTLILRRYIPKLRDSKIGLTLVFSSFSLFMVLMISFLHPNFELYRIGSVIVTNYEAFAAISDSNDYIHFNDLTSDFLSLIYHAPKAFFSGLLRPFIWESGGNIFKLISGVENTLVLVLSISSLFYMKNLNKTNNFLLILAALFFSVAMLTFLSMSAPNFGTLIRYKSVAMPFLILIITLNNPFIIKLMKWKL